MRVASPSITVALRCRRRISRVAGAKSPSDRHRGRVTPTTPTARCGADAVGVVAVLPRALPPDGPPVPGSGEGAVGIDDELLRGATVEVGVAAGGVVQGDHGGVHCLRDLHPVVQDGLHQALL